MPRPGCESQWSWEKQEQGSHPFVVHLQKHAFLGKYLYMYIYIHVYIHIYIGIYIHIDV